MAYWKLRLWSYDLWHVTKYAYYIIIIISSSGQNVNKYVNNLWETLKLNWFLWYINVTKISQEYYTAILILFSKGT